LSERSTYGPGDPFRELLHTLVAHTVLPLEAFQEDSGARLEVHPAFEEVVVGPEDALVCLVRQSRNLQLRLDDATGYDYAAWMNRRH